MHSLILDKTPAPVSVPKGSITLPCPPPSQVETLFKAGICSPQLHHEKIFKERCFAIPLFAMSDKICSATNAS